MAVMVKDQENLIQLCVQNVGAKIHIFRSIRLEEHNAAVKDENREVIWVCVSLPVIRGRK